MKNFTIQNKGIISDEFLNRKITDFHSACQYISMLPYKRNNDKSRTECIFDDFGGTCSTKHAALRKLALENQHSDIKLILGIFKMDAEYTPKIRGTLQKFNLKYIPEAHNYLKIDDEYYDFTNRSSHYQQFKDKLLIEQEIEFKEIGTQKISFHKDFLEKLLNEERITYSLDELWNIREQCIMDLQQIDEPEIQNSSLVCCQNSSEVRDEYRQ